MVKIQLVDVNDNRPTFYPTKYNVTLREGGASLSATVPVATVLATDPDSGRFGAVTYKIVAGNEAGLFRLERNTGEIFVSRPGLLSTRSQRSYSLNISASDGGNLKAAKDAVVFVSVMDSTEKLPIFDHSKYMFSVSENVKMNTIIGNVRATVTDNGECLQGVIFSHWHNWINTRHPVWLGAGYT